MSIQCHVLQCYYPNFHNYMLVQEEWEWCDGASFDYNNWNDSNTNVTQLSSGDLVLNCSKMDAAHGDWIKTPCEQLLTGFVCKIKKGIKYLYFF